MSVCARVYVLLVKYEESNNDYDDDELKCCWMLNNIIADTSRWFIVKSRMSNGAKPEYDNECLMSAPM